MVSKKWMRRVVSSMLVVGMCGLQFSTGFPEVYALDTKIQGESDTKDGGVQLLTSIERMTYEKDEQTKTIEGIHAEYDMTPLMEDGVTSVDIVLTIQLERIKETWDMDEYKTLTFDMPEFFKLTQAEGILYEEETHSEMADYSIHGQQITLQMKDINADSASKCKITLTLHVDLLKELLDESAQSVEFVLPDGEVITVKLPAKTSEKEPIPSEKAEDEISETAKEEEKPSLLASVEAKSITNVATYDEFKTAMSNASDGDTIHITKALSVNSDFTSDKQVSLTMANNLTVFTIAGAYKLELKNITIDGGTIFKDKSGNVITSPTDEDYAQNEGNYTYRMFYLNHASASLLLDNVHLSNMKTTSDGAGLVYVVSGELNIRNSSFENIYNSGHGFVYLHDQISAKANFSGTTFKNIYATGSGAAIFRNNAAANSSALVMDDCTFEHNSAVGGGAVWLNGAGSLVSIKNSIIKDNLARTNNGGGAYLAGNITIENTEIMNNTSLLSQGGGLYLNNNKANSGYAITDSKFHGNRAGKEGGALFSFSSVLAATIANTTFESNTSASSGGAIYWHQNTGQLKDVEFTHNQATKGGAIYHNTGIVEISQTNFEHNQANLGGAYYQYTGTVNINTQADTKTIWKNNNATQFGGAIYANAGNLNMNTDTSGTVLMSENTANIGGAVYSAGMTTFTMKGSVDVQNNHADVSSAGIFMFNSALKMQDEIIINNNTIGTKKSNLQLNSTSTFALSGALKDTSIIGVISGAVIPTTPVAGIALSANISAYYDKTETHIVSDDAHYEVFYASNVVKIKPDNSVVWTPTTRSVGTGKEYTTLHEAVLASDSGDTIEIYGTVEVGTMSEISHELTFVGKENACLKRGKDNHLGFMRTLGDRVFTLTIQDIVFDGNKEQDAYGRTMLYFNNTKGTVKIKNSGFINNINKGEDTAEHGSVYLHNSKTEMEDTYFKNNESIGVNAGALYLANTTSVLERCDFEENTSSLQGGALFTSYGSMTVRDSSFKRNKAKTHGGGIVNSEGTTTLENCSVEENIANYHNNAGSHAGGIYGYGGNVILKDTIIQNNAIESDAASTNYGGGVYALNAVVTINGTTSIEHNTNKGVNDNLTFDREKKLKFGDAINDDTRVGVGLSNATRTGVLSAAGMDASLYQKQFFASSNAYELGVDTSKQFVLSSRTTPSTLEVGDGLTYTTVEAAYADTIDGDSIRIFGTVIMKNCIKLTKDLVMVNGDSDAKLLKSEELNNHMFHNTGAFTLKATGITFDGGAIWADEHKNVVSSPTDLTCTQNIGVPASSYQIIRQETNKGGKTQLVNCVVENADSSSVGGAMRLDAGSLSLKNTKLINNMATEGGGLYMSSANLVSFESQGNLYQGNYAKSNGGAIRAQATTVLSAYTYSDDVFENNVAGTNGGAIYTQLPNMKVSNVRFEKNVAKTGGGGAIVLHGLAGHEITNSQFLSNTYNTYGGGIYVYTNTTDVHVTGTTFKNNQGGNVGGGIGTDANNAKNIVIESSEFSENQAKTKGAALCSYVTTNTEITDTKIYENVSDGESGGIFASGATTKISNSKIENNTAKTNGAGLLTSNANNVVTISNTSLNENRAESGLGGGVYLYLAKSVTIENNSEILRNSAGSNGGGIHLNSTATTLNLNDATITGNRAKHTIVNQNNGYGGGIYGNSSHIMVGGATIIKDNMSGIGNADFTDRPDNLFMVNNSYSIGATSLPLANTASIGVFYQSPVINNPITTANSFTKTEKNKFFTDSYLFDLTYDDTSKQIAFINRDSGKELAVGGTTYTGDFTNLSSAISKAEGKAIIHVYPMDDGSSYVMDTALINAAKAKGITLHLYNFEKGVSDAPYIEYEPVAGAMYVNGNQLFGESDTSDSGAVYRAGDQPLKATSMDIQAKLQVFGGNGNKDITSSPQIVLDSGRYAEIHMGGSNGHDVSIPKGETAQLVFKSGSATRLFAGGKSFNSPSDSADVSGDVHIQVEGGSLQAIHGGGNVMGTSSNNTGTVTIEMNGGSVSAGVYGGGRGYVSSIASTPHHYTRTENVILNLNGGEIGYLAACGGIANAYVGNAVMNLNGTTMYSTVVGDMLDKSNFVTAAGDGDDLDVWFAQKNEDIVNKKDNCTSTDEHIEHMMDIMTDNGTKELGYGELGNIVEHAQINVNTTVGSGYGIASGSGASQSNYVKDVDINIKKDATVKSIQLGNHYGITGDMTLNMEEGAILKNAYAFGKRTYTNMPVGKLTYNASGNAYSGTTNYYLGNGSSDVSTLFGYPKTAEVEYHIKANDRVSVNTNVQDLLKLNIDKGALVMNSTANNTIINPLAHWDVNDLLWTSGSSYSAAKITNEGSLLIRGNMDMYDSSNTNKNEFESDKILVYEGVLNKKMKASVPTGAGVSVIYGNIMGKGIVNGVENTDVMNALDEMDTMIYNLSNQEIVYKDGGTTNSEVLHHWNISYLDHFDADPAQYENGVTYFNHYDKTGTYPTYVAMTYVHNGKSTGITYFKELKTVVTKNGKLNIEFDTNGGTSLPSQDVDYLDNVHEPILPKKEGYHLDGWYQDADLKKPWDFTNDKVEDALTLYADWEANTYSISYDANDGTGDVEKTDMVYDKAGQLANNGFRGMRRVQYHSNIAGNEVATYDVDVPFLNWNTKKDGSGKAYHELETVKNLSAKEDDVVQLYAQWDSAIITLKEIEETRVGYTFSGWYFDPSFNKKAGDGGDSVVLNDHMQLYAKWVKDIEPITPLPPIENDDPKEEETPKEETTKEESTNASTGDATRLLPSILLMMVSLAGMLLIRKKKQS